jgi:hypothetical protein
VPVSATRLLSAHPLRPNDALTCMMPKAKVMLLFRSNKHGLMDIYHPPYIQSQCVVLFMYVSMCVFSFHVEIKVIHHDDVLLPLAWLIN